MKTPTSRSTSKFRNVKTPSFWWIIPVLLIIVLILIWKIHSKIYPQNPIQNQHAPVAKIISPSPIRGSLLITDVSPSSGSIGAQVTLSGSGFSPTDNKIWFDKLSIGNYISATRTVIHFTIPRFLTGGCVQTLDDFIKGSSGAVFCNALSVVPIHAGLHTITVTNKNKEISNQINFTVLQ